VQQLAEKLISGVPLCKDLKLLDDPASAFGHFKENYPGNRAVEENKQLLKAKYGEAKSTGEKVNKARSAINYLKTTIEQLRRERAMERVVEGGGDGEEKGGEESKDDDFVDPEEQQHRKAIEQEKYVYKENFGRLRELKSAIEHIQKLLEKSRVKMQSDFDVWYKHCIDFVGRYGGGAGRGGGGGGGGGVERRVGAEPETKGGGDYGDGDADDSSRSLNTTQMSGYSGGGGASARGGQENVNTSANTQRASYAKAQPKGPPAAGPKLTGNKEADDDIAAFFKAKEELLRRNNQAKN